MPEQYSAAPRPMSQPPRDRYVWPYPRTMTISKHVTNHIKITSWNLTFHVHYTHNASKIYMKSKPYSNWTVSFHGIVMNTCFLFHFLHHLMVSKSDNDLQVSNFLFSAYGQVHFWTQEITSLLVRVYFVTYNAGHMSLYAMQTDSCSIIVHRECILYPILRFQSV